MTNSIDAVYLGSVLRRDTRQAARRQHEEDASSDARSLCNTATWRGPPVTIRLRLGTTGLTTFLSLRALDPPVACRKQGMRHGRLRSCPTSAAPCRPEQPAPSGHSTLRGRAGAAAAPALSFAAQRPSLQPLHAVAAQDENAILRHGQFRHRGRVEPVEVPAQHAADAAMAGDDRVAASRRPASRRSAPSDPRSFRRPSGASGTYRASAPRCRQRRCPADPWRRCPASGRSGFPSSAHRARSRAARAPWRCARSPWSRGRAATGWRHSCNAGDFRAAARARPRRCGAPGRGPVSFMGTSACPW